MKKTKKRRNGGGSGGSGFFNSVSDKDGNVIYLNPGKLGDDYTWGAVYLPHLKGDDPKISTPEFVCAKINQIYDFLMKRSNSVLTKCSFNKTVQKRIDEIKATADNYDQNFDKLCNQFIEIQLYAMVCKNQTTNRGFGMKLIGNILSR